MSGSIGRAWDETRALFARDGGKIATVALATILLPGAVLETYSPAALRTVDDPLWVNLASLAVMLLSLLGQMAVSRIALGPPLTVGAALGRSARRLPVLALALFLAALPFALAASAVLVAISPDGRVPEKIDPAMAALLLVIALGFLFVFMRLLFAIPMSVERDGGARALIRGSWRASRRSTGKLAVLLAVLMLCYGVVLFGLGRAIGATIILLFGPIAAGNTSALLVALIGGVLALVVSVPFVLVIARLYAQARAGEATASVPDAGHQ